MKEINLQKQGPAVPEVLQDCLDIFAMDAHEEMRRRTLDKVPLATPRLVCEGDTNATYYVFRPEGFGRGRPDYDATKAVVHLYPYANGMDPHMRIRSKLLQDSLIEKKQLIAFPHNTLKNNYYFLSPKDKEKVRHSNFDPLSDIVMRSLDRAGVEEIDIVGYSLGGDIGANLLKRAKITGTFAVNSVMLGEPTRIVSRSKRQLSRDFREGGFGNFVQAVKDSDLPVLEDAQGVRTKKQFPKVAASLAGFAISTIQNKENRVIKDGMAASGSNYSKFFWDATRFPSSVDIRHSIFAYGAYSKIVPEDVIKNTSRCLKDWFTIVELPYGHEAADNVVLHALLAKKAIEGIVSPASSA